MLAWSSHEPQQAIEAASSILWDYIQFIIHLLTSLLDFTFLCRFSSAVTTEVTKAHDKESF
jgi:hypothetical protein